MTLKVVLRRNHYIIFRYTQYHHPPSLRLEVGVLSCYQIEGLRNKLIIDIVSNINTVQKMRSVNFMNNCFDTENKKLIKATKKWAIFNELAKKGIKSAIVYWPEFLRSLKASLRQVFPLSI